MVDYTSLEMDCDEIANDLGVAIDSEFHAAMFVEMGRHGENFSPQEFVEAYSHGEI